jgi:hypothetical protein
MYARIARFEGGTVGDIIGEADEARADLDAVKRGKGNMYFPKELTDRVSRMEMLVDRQQSSVAIILYCESEANVREVDRIMDGMSPQREGWGRRVSSDVYEVVLDEALGVRRAA